MTVHVLCWSPRPTVEEVAPVEKLSTLMARQCSMMAHAIMPQVQVADLEQNGHPALAHKMDG